MKNQMPIVECTFVNQTMVYESMPVSSTESIFSILQTMTTREEYDKGGLIGQAPIVIINYQYDDGVAALNIFKTQDGWMSIYSITRYRRWKGLPMPSKTTSTDFKTTKNHAALHADIRAGFATSVATLESYFGIDNG